MAQHRADKSGINADIQQKLEELYDEDLELECRIWMENVTREPFPEADPQAMEEIEREFKGKDFHVALRDGLYLCKLIKALNPDSRVIGKLPRFSPKHPFQQRDLIQTFLDACREYGVHSDTLFETEDLHSAVNMNMAQKNGYQGPLFGPKYADKNERIFDEQTIQEGKRVIGLQMGYNLGASQSGMTPYGQARQIYDPKFVEEF